MTKERLGVLLAIELFVFAQFFELSLFSIGNFEVTIQKVSALIVLPLALGLMGQVRIPSLLVTLLALMLASNAFWYAVHGDVLNELVVSTNISALFVFIGALALYTALALDTEGIKRLGKVWIRYGLVTSLVCVFQSLSIVPLFAVSSNDLFAREAVGNFYRAVGFKFDPNFQALMLVIASVFVIAFARRGVQTFLYLALIFIGILSTFSRMGLLMFLLVILGGWMLTSLGERLSTGRVKISPFVTTVAVFFSALFVFMYIPKSVAAYFHQRFTEVMEALVTAGSIDTVVQYGYVVPTSAEMRVILAFESIDILRSNIWLGIGAYRSEELLYAGTGVQNVAHNTYLEIALTGGLLGILFLVLYFLPLLRIIVRTPELLRRYQRRDFVLVSLMLYIVFSVGFLFLSLNYNSILYLPVVVGLALMTYSSRELQFRK